MNDDEHRLENEKKFVENRGTSKKIIRIVTVLAYVSSVSMAAVMLSLYYLFLWNSSAEAEPARLVHQVEFHHPENHLNFPQKVNRGSSNGTAGSEIKFAANDKDKMYEPKHKRKLVRVLTVIGYIFSVSLAAIMLSLFYVFVYNPRKPAGQEEKGERINLLQNSHAQRGFQTINEELLTSLNNTYFNLEKEEPRVLPLEEFENSFRSEGKNLAENKTYARPKAEYLLKSKKYFPKKYP